MDAPISPNSPGWFWVGTAILALVVLFFLFDAIAKLILIKPVIDTTISLGWPVESARPLGILLLACTILYVIPRTSILGAILLTGYLGGAVATQARVGNPLFTHVLFGVYVGILVWLAIFIRDPNVRRLLLG